VRDDVGRSPADILEVLIRCDYWHSGLLGARGVDSRQNGRVDPSDIRANVTQMC